jgi:ADP-ribose pyrophosphatase YjhB (NUDIX family)
VFDEENRVLLLKHRFRPGSGWGLPGGFLHAGEQADMALRRELIEEVGLEPEAVELFKIRVFTRPRQIEVMYRCRARNGGSPKSVEVSEMRWFEVDDLPADLPEDQRRLINQAETGDHRTELR